MVYHGLPRGIVIFVAWNPQRPGGALDQRAPPRPLRGDPARGSTDLDEGRGSLRAWALGMVMKCHEMS